MNIKRFLPSTQQKQSGMVAIMVTLILMIVISLIVLGFAQISRRNQRQALDRQLSTQAFYAAETGINDTAELLTAAMAAGGTVPTKQDCASTGGGFYTPLDPVVNAASNVKYTCVMVDPLPDSLLFSALGMASKVTPINPTSGTVASLTFTWKKLGPTLTPATGCPTTKNTVFTANDAAWACGYGVLRFDLVPTAGAALTMDGLRNSTMTTFVVPLRPGSSGAGVDTGTITYAAGGAQSLWGRVCTQNECTLTVNGLTQSQYHLRVSSLYKEVSLEVVARDASGAELELRDAQAVIDVTGKAQDVLRRVQVRIPLSGTSANLLSDYALQSTEAICKRFTVMDGFFLSDANAVVPGVGNNAYTDNPLCD